MYCRPTFAGFTSTIYSCLPLLTRFGNLSIQAPPIQTLGRGRGGEGEFQENPTGWEGGGGECHLFLVRNHTVLLGNRFFFFEGNGTLTTVAYEKEAFFISLACLAKRFSSTKVKFRT